MKRIFNKFQSFTFKQKKVKKKIEGDGETDQSNLFTSVNSI